MSDFFGRLKTSIHEKPKNVKLTKEEKMAAKATGEATKVATKIALAEAPVVNGIAAKAAGWIAEKQAEEFMKDPGKFVRLMGKTPTGKIAKAAHKLLRESSKTGAKTTINKATRTPSAGPC